MENNTEELVEHPNHYKWMEDEIGVEPYKICELFNFNIGNCLKYLFRAGKKLYNNKDSAIFKQALNLIYHKKHSHQCLKRITPSSP